MEIIKKIITIKEILHYQYIDDDEINSRLKEMLNDLLIECGNQKCNFGEYSILVYKYQIILSHIEKGKRIEAIKVLREAAKISLVEARDEIDLFIALTRE